MHIIEILRMDFKFSTIHYFFHIIILPIYLEDRMTDRRRVPISGLISQMTTTDRTGSGRNYDPIIPSVIPLWVARTQRLKPSPATSQTAYQQLAKPLAGSRQDQGLNAGCHCSEECLIIVPKTHSQIHLFISFLHKFCKISSHMITEYI